MPRASQRNVGPVPDVVACQVEEAPRAEGGLVRAYVLVQTETTGQQLSQKLVSVPGVLSAEDLTGAYDAIVLAAADSMRQLIDKVIAKILALPGVTRALPAPLIHSMANRPNDASSDGQEGMDGRAA
jgi:DNA-binding Lrp family transcriptional regulator